MILFALLGLSGNVGRNWFNRQGLEIQAIRDPTTSPSAEQNLKIAQPLMEQNGINSNDPENVIYL